MNYEPVEVIRFQKTVEGRTIECTLERCDDGSVGVFGEELGTWIFEFTDEAFERAIERVEQEGYARVQE